MRSLFVILLFSVFALGSKAQSESGLWLGADVSYDITSRLGAEAEIGSRLENDWSTFTRYDAAVGVDYKVAKWLKLGVGYDFIRDYSPGEAPSLVYKKGEGNLQIIDGKTYDANGKPVDAEGYRVNSSGYRIVNGYNAESDYWRTKNRLYFDVTEKWKWGRVGFSLRERYQFTHYAKVKGCEQKYRTEYEYDDFLTADIDMSHLLPYVDEEGDTYWYGLTRTENKKAKDKHYFRTRLAIDYNIRRCPVTPFASYEIANDLGDAFAIVRHRLMAGFDWTLTHNKQHALSVAYLYQHGAEDEAGNNDLHVLSIGYKFKFESALAKAQKKAKKKAQKEAKSNK